MATDGNDVPIELLRVCYEALMERRWRRGAQSLRTRQGYERLRTQYQPRLRFLQATDEKQHGDNEVEDASDTSALNGMVGVFFDARIKRFVLEILWPLAHHGGNGSDLKEDRPMRMVAEWQELDKHKYFAFMLKTVLWLFPGLPAYEAQELNEDDWHKDCEFDSYGSLGLSFEGFMISILDLALACTDSSVEKCIEFLTQLAKRLETSLPIFRVPTTSMLPSLTDESIRDQHIVNTYDQILWRTIPLERLLPCPVRARPQFLELKAKLSVAPVILMVLASNERPFELQLSTSAKLLVRESDHRSSVRRNTMQSNVRSHFIEVEKQFLWTFRAFPSRPTLVLVPSGLVNKRTLSLYACCRVLESHEHMLDDHNHAESVVDPILTLFTAVPDPFPLLFGASDSLCGRIDRHSSRLFVVDHRGHDAKSFKIIFKTSLIHNTSSAGGAGAAAVITPLANVDSTGTARCKSELLGGASSSQTTTHSYIFVVRLTSDILANGPQRDRATTVGAGTGTSSSSEANVPAQWFTTLCGANENKTIYIDKRADRDEDPRGDSMAGTYYIYVFTLHGFYFEAFCEDNDKQTGISEVEEGDEDSPLSLLLNPEAKTARGDTHVAMKTSSDDGLDIAVNVEDFVKNTNSRASVTTSATLLRQLLHLRKQRQLRMNAKPPPECIGGSKITSMKTITAAAGLRAKFLKARAEERHTRFVQNEELFRSKVVAKLLKAASKRKVMRGGSPDPELQQTSEGTTTHAISTISASLEAKATLMVNFFKEMAMYQPTQRELDDEQNVPVDQEEELLEDFADLFHDDHALQNMLDQEKWMTVEDKSARRQSLMDERKRSRQQSLLMLNKQQVREFQGEVYDANNAQDKSKRSATSRASEDYYSTAMLINQLMQEAADEEREQAKSASPDNNKTHEVQENEELEELALSWGYALNAVRDQASVQRDVPSSQSPSYVENQPKGTNSEFNKLEDIRREDWLSSHHTHHLAQNERLRMYQSTLRSSLVPTHKSFEHQEDKLPWHPIWEVEVSTEETRGAQHIISHSIPRPQTAGAVVYSPRPPSSMGRRDRSATVNAAAFARNHTRRIRSAHLKPTGRSTITPEQRVGQPQQQHKPIITHIPNVFLHEPYGVVVGDDESFEGVSTLDKSETCNPDLTNDQLQQYEDICASGTKGEDEVAPAETAPNCKSKRKRKKKPTNEEKRFSGRVRELLSMSPLVQSFAQTGSRKT